MRDLDIKYARDWMEAERYLREGYEPIECCFGMRSVLGPLEMDHHGPESHREGVAIRACRDHYGARSDSKKFVVTGRPDADAVLAIIALAGLVPREKIPLEFADLVNRRDVDPISTPLLEEPYGLLLLAFQQLTDLKKDESSFYRAVNKMRTLLLEGLSESEKEKIKRKEERRLLLAQKAYKERISPEIMLVSGNVWGFDVWYREAPVIVSYSSKGRSITIGCPSEKVAKELFGEEGLLRVFRELGEDWGGRETIGGSPRSKEMTLDDAREIAYRIEKIMNGK